MARFVPLTRQPLLLLFVALFHLWAVERSTAAVDDSTDIACVRIRSIGLIGGILGHPCSQIPSGQIETGNAAYSKPAAV